MQQYPTQPLRTVVAGESNSRGEKVNNLLQALERVDADTDVFVFADSDGRPPSTWLRDLVAPLWIWRDGRRDAAQDVGATTGYRWYLPEPGNLPSVLRSAWNAGIATFLGPHGRNFCWGGSMAIRRETFEKIQVRKFWQHSISDDYSLTQALRQAKLKIHFVPRCLIPSGGRVRWREVTQWATRQLIITRIYSNPLWKLAFVLQGIFSVGILLGWGLLPIEWHRSPGIAQFPSAPLSAIKAFSVTGLLMAVFLLAFVRGFYRWRAIRCVLPPHRANLNRFAWVYIVLPPLISLWSAYLLFRSALTRRVCWRGRVYELISSDKMKVLE